jgi:hypothetical protein
MRNTPLAPAPRGEGVSSRNALKLGLYSEALILPGENPLNSENSSTSTNPNTTRRPLPARRRPRPRPRDLAHSPLRPHRSPVHQSPLLLLYAGRAAIRSWSRLLQGRRRSQCPQKIERRRAGAMREARRLIQELAPLLPATDPPSAPARPVKGLPPNSVRFGAAPSPPITTPVRTPHDNWDNPALRL